MINNFNNWLNEVLRKGQIEDAKRWSEWRNDEVRNRIEEILGSGGAIYLEDKWNKIIKYKDHFKIDDKMKKDLEEKGYCVDEYAGKVFKRRELNRDELIERGRLKEEIEEFMDIEDLKDVNKRKELFKKLNSEQRGKVSKWEKMGALVSIDLSKMIMSGDVEREIYLLNIVERISKGEINFLITSEPIKIMQMSNITDKEEYKQGERIKLAWISCMSSVIGVERDGIIYHDEKCEKVIRDQSDNYLKYDIQHGTLICYIYMGDRSNLNPELNTNNTLGRILIKPFYNKEKRVIRYFVERELYSSINFSLRGKGLFKELLRESIEDYLESKVEYPLGIYYLVDKLYDDNNFYRVEILITPENLNWYNNYIKSANGDFSDLKDDDIKQIWKKLLKEWSGKSNEWKLVKNLIKEFGFNIEIEDDLYLFSYIIYHEVDIELIKEFINLGVDINGEDENDFPIIWTNNIKIIKLIMDNGIDLEKKSRNGINLLMQSIEKGFNNLVRELIRVGINIDERDDLGNTALMRAVKSDEIDVVKILLKSGADKKIKDGIGKDVMERAMSEEMRRILKKYE